MQTDSNTTIEFLKSKMKHWVAERHWQKYHLPKNLAASVSIESAELLELFQWLTPEEAEQKSKDPEFKRMVGEEMCDVLMYLISLANAIDLDLATAVEAKMIKNAAKYPKDKFQGHYERPARNE